MESVRHPFRKFVFGSAAKSSDGLYYSLTGARFGRPIRLDPAEFELARLFDGSRDAAGVRKAALELLRIELDPAELERFVNDLASTDLMFPGLQEPLPVPAQTEGEAANLGWTKGPKPRGVSPDVITPSTIPGSLTGVGFPGSLTGLWGAFRGVTQPPVLRFNAGPLLPLGMLMNLPMIAGILSMLLLSALVIGAVVAMWTHRIDMGRDFLRLLDPVSLFASGLGCAYLVNLLSELARASAIASATRSKPIFGMMLGLALIPRFHTDTGGAAEAATRPARLRIIGSAIVAHLLIFVLAVTLWLVFRNGHGLLPSLAMMLVLVTSAFFFIQINPLAKRDGYHLLVHAWQASDLREQAIYALFGYARPWNEGRKLSGRFLAFYAAIFLLYAGWVILWILLFPGSWLRSSYGGVGVALVLLIVIYGIWQSLRRAQASRGSIGANKVNVQVPRRVDWLVIGLLSALALFPYPYQPSGSFTVLPIASADIRSQTAGAVREVMVKEGEMVKAGQIIARLGDDEERAAVATSVANLAKLKSQLAISRQGGKSEEVETVRQQIATAQKKLEFSRAEANRLSTAFAKKAVSDQEYQRALSIAEVDQQKLLEARKQLSLVSSPARNEQVQAIEADMAREQALLELHQTQLDSTGIKAPIAGRIVSGSLRYAVGDYLERGQQLATVVDSAQLLVEIRLSETDVGDVEIGDKAYAKAWAFPNAAYPGVIREIAPAAEISEYGKVVRVVMAVDAPDGKLIPEMTGYAKVTTETYPLIVAFTRPVIRFVKVEIWSWLP